MNIQKKKQVPVVTVLGHVNHGKSSLLNIILDFNLTDKEHGGITQHMGAYTARHKDRELTFLDTPGHDAFSSIRDECTSVADIAVLVIASDEGWKEQTKDSYKCIKEAGIPFVIAFSKKDAAESNLEKAKQSVMKEGLLLEGLGGDIPWVHYSTKTKEGLDELLEVILLSADMQESKPNIDTGIVGTIIETEIDQKAGISATILVHSDSLEKGVFLVADDTYAPTRIMLNSNGEKIEMATKSQPIKIVGFSSIPKVGSSVRCFENKKSAEKYIKENEQSVDSEKPVYKYDKKEEDKQYLIIKADTAGSSSAIQKKIGEMQKEFSFIKIANVAVGPISEKDLNMSRMHSGSYIIGFNVKAERDVLATAAQQNIDAEIFNSIYDIEKWVEEKAKSFKTQQTQERNTGRSKVIKVFEQKEDSVIFGSRIIEGTFSVNQNIALMRGKEKIGDLKINAIQQHKKELKEVSGAKQEFAVQTNTAHQLEVGDTLIGCIE